MALATLLPETTPTPEEEELRRKQARLSQLEAELAERELELASFLGELVHFERQYLHSVGRRYAILDDLKAKIAEARARRDPKNRQTRDQADQARKQAEESARAAGQHEPAEKSFFRNLLARSSSGWYTLFHLVNL